MRILVEHGAHANLGDLAMLDGDARRLRHVLPGATLWIVYRAPASQAGLWETALGHPPRQAMLPPYRVRSPLERLGPFIKGRYGRRLTPLLRLGLEHLRPDGRTRLVTRGQTTSLEAFCAPFDGLFLAGGAYLSDLLLPHLLDKCGLIRTFARQGKPVVLSGQQLGPFCSPVFRELLCRTLPAARFVGLREPVDSVAVCARAGLAPGRYDVMGDDALLCPPADDRAVDAALRPFGLEDRPFLAVNLRVARYAIRPGTLEKALALFGCLSRAWQMPVLFVPISLNEADNDLTAARQLAGGAFHVLDRNDLTPGLAKGVICRAWGAVGTSYHFCLFALSQGLPAVCLHEGMHYAQKARGHAALWGDARLGLALADCSAEEAAGQVSAVFDDPALRERLPHRARELAAHWQTTFDGYVTQAFG